MRSRIRGGEGVLGAACAALFVACAAVAASIAAADEPSKALALFDQRIVPILQSEKPSSCAECHLSGVDLKDYIRPTQRETYAALVAAGLIDPRAPEKSKLLAFIAREPERPSLVAERARREELAAFRAWIEAAVKDPQLMADREAAVKIGPQLPSEVVRHARRDRVLASFIDKVWNEVGRCAACHSPDRNQEQVRKHGERVSWIQLRDPQRTLDELIERDLIDFERPEQSLLLRKPLAEVEHGGGQKMVVGDRTYKQFRSFIDDLAAVRGGKYRTSAELPRPASEVSRVTDIWLKLTDVPQEYDRRLLQVDLHARTAEGWSAERVATSDRPVFGGGRLWQHSLSLVARRGTEWAEKIGAERLPPGRYLAKLYLDRDGKLARDFRAELGARELVGEVEFESRWPAGYGQMTVIKFPEPKR